MSDFGDVMLSLWPDLAGLIAILSGALILIGVARLARRAWLRQRRTGDTGIAAGRATRPMDLGGLVISAEGERLLQARAAALTPDAPTGAIGVNPAIGCPCCPGARSNDCTCRRPCGCPSCQAIDPAGGCTWCSLLVWEWPCTCDRACGDPACVPAVRRG